MSYIQPIYESELSYNQVHFFILLYIYTKFIIYLAGSKFGQSGMFEVTKAEDDCQSICGISSSSPSSSPSQNVSMTKSPSALRVTVPTELHGVSYIMVLCQKGNFMHYITLANA